LNSGNRRDDIRQGKAEKHGFSQLWLAHSRDCDSVRDCSTCHKISIQLTDRQIADNFELCDAKVSEKSIEIEIEKEKRKWIHLEIYFLNECD
jgi:hypothetical protein